MSDKAKNGKNGKNGIESKSLDSFTIETSGDCLKAGEGKKGGFSRMFPKDFSFGTESKPNGKDLAHFGKIQLTDSGYAAKFAVFVTENAVKGFESLKKTAQGAIAFVSEDRTDCALVCGFFSPADIAEKAKVRNAQPKFAALYKGKAEKNLGSQIAYCVGHSRSFLVSPVKIASDDMKRALISAGFVGLADCKAGETRLLGHGCKAIVPSKA